MKKDTAFFFTILLSFFFFFLSIKGGSYISISNGFIVVESEINYSPLIALIKSYALYISALTLSLLYLFSLKGKVYNHTINLSLIKFYLIAITLYQIRLFVDFETDKLKIVISIFLLYIFYFFLKNLLNRSLTIKIFIDKLLKSYLFFSILFNSLNLYLYLSGQGYIQGVNRFFGITSHPNFLSVLLVQSCIIFVFLGMEEGNQIKKYFLFVPMFLISALLIFYSASRTGILMLSVGFICIFINALKNFKINNFYKKLSLGLIFIFLLIMLFYFIFIGDLFISSEINSFDVYDRINDTGNNRVEPWMKLLSNFYSNIFFGIGHSIEASENSFLKLIAVSGFIPGIFLILCFFGLLKIATKLIFTKANFIPGIPIFAIFSLTQFVGSNFEGFLFEKFGMMPYLFLIDLFIISLAISNKSLCLK